MRQISTFLIVAGAVSFLSACNPDHGSRNAQIDQPSIGQDSRELASPDSSSSPTPSPHPAAVSHSSAQPDGRPLVVCFGDSLTAGYGADDGQSYPDFLQKDLDADGFHYRVVNEGISGNTTKDGADRLAEVIALKPSVVVLEFGGNDGLRGFKVQTTRTNLSIMISGLQHAGARVVLAGITLPPDYGPDYVSTFTASYPILARKYNVPLLPFILKDVYGIQGMMQQDNIHATNRGNEIVARNLVPLVEPLLKK